MKILNRTMVLLSLLLAFPVLASEEDTSLKGSMKPIYELAADTKTSAGVVAPVCFGGFDIHGLPFVGAVNPQLHVCEYLYKQSDSELSQKMILDGAHAEWMDISYDELLVWLNKHATKFVDGATNEPYFMFNYSQITGSVSTLQQQNTPICARWINERQLSFGYLMPKGEGKSVCLSSGFSSYVAPERSWRDSFDNVIYKAWCSNLHDFNFCSPTEDAGAGSEKECAESAIAKTNAAGYCWDGGTCCHVTDKLNENDRDGDNNKCYLKKGKNKENYLVRCQKTSF